MKITLVAGARPNFIKIAPIIEAIEIKIEQGIDIDYRLVHTGQHYDKNLSDTFFKELNIPDPHVNLDAQSGSQATQTAKIMIEFEKELNNNPCDLVMVVGDVNSTMACAIVAKKAGVKLAHVEAGIRSEDLTMPEEINRIVTDSITDYFFTTSEIANENLRTLGVNDATIFYVGNVMIDTLRKNEARLKKPRIWSVLKLVNDNYLLMTLHRPSNVDDKLKLKSLIEAISVYAEQIPIVFPVHPRTAKMLKELNIKAKNLHLTEPLGYLEFNFLLKHSKAVITDSGGITEEATVFKVPCMTIRENTERPETCDLGTNILVGNDLDKLKDCFDTLHSNSWKSSEIPPLWDGNTAKRIVDHLMHLYKL